MLLLSSPFDLESKPNQTNEDKNRETRSERHKRVSRRRNGNKLSSLKLIVGVPIAAPPKYPQLEARTKLDFYRINPDLLANICQFNLVIKCLQTFGAFPKILLYLIEELPSPQLEQRTRNFRTRFPLFKPFSFTT